MARPTDYQPDYCERVIKFGRDGKSLVWMASELDVHKDTIYEWMKVYPEFSDAMTRARQLSQRWWEDMGQEGMTAPGFNASIWSRSMAARFPDDWRENKGVELSGGVKVTNATELTDDALAAIATGSGK